ncbi:unnamed protein product [Mesocestoides corti]|uniref:AB hydrolase-1 domain-containing protein n=2 Tax=Mesocestoides corti TaxID=53468 RepID=A0A158QSA5_MESCO|nr:unnamed protein product [Mesocestoides corti]
MFSLSDYSLIDAYTGKLLISCLVGAYTAYYWISARSEVYSPFVFGFTGRVQTILRPIFHRCRKLNYDDECVVFPDGGEMSLSWSNVDALTDESPTVVLLPGLTGCGCCNYIASLVKEINESGYRCVVFNNRGTCRRKLKTARTYCACDTSDMALVLDRIRSRYPSAPMMAIGISLGALIVFNYLADQGKGSSADESEPQSAKNTCPLTAAMCICMPWDVAQTSDKLEKSLDWFLFNYPLTKSLQRLVIRNADVLSEKYDIPKILKSRSVREFDANMTVDMFGYKSVEDYYAQASPAAKIDDIKVPVLCLNAADDPFVPFETLPLEAVKQSDNVVLAVTRHGGHIGFLAGLTPTRPSLLDRAVPQVVSAVFQNLEEFKAVAACY